MSVSERKERLLRVFPERIRNLRNAIGVSQDTFARALGVSRAAIGYYESGDRLPDIAFLDELCMLTGCDVEYLFGGTDAMVKAPSSFDDLVEHVDEISDSLLTNIKQLMRKQSFLDFICSNDTVDIFDFLDRTTLLSDYGSDELAGDIVSFLVTPRVVKILKEVFFAGIDSHYKHNTQFYKERNKQRDDLFAKYNITHAAYIKDREAYELQRAKRDMEYESWRKERDKEMSSDPFFQFRKKMIGERKSEGPSNEQETR